MPPTLLIVMGSDSACDLTSHLITFLRKKGYQLRLLGALEHPNDEKTCSPWAQVGLAVGRAVVAASAPDTTVLGIVCCWTGTGVSMAANKVPGVRCALCCDASTASGARAWNDANICALSIRCTSLTIAEEILEAFLAPIDASKVDEVDRANLQWFLSYDRENEKL